MSDKTNDDTPDLESTDVTQNVEPTSHNSSTWKVLGEKAAPTGAGVLGHNTASSGTAVGVEGVTDSPNGYGLYTPNDARIEGNLRIDVDAKILGRLGIGTTSPSTALDVAGIITADATNTVDVTTLSVTADSVTASSSDKNGNVVFGENTASSGTPIGVEGATPNTNEGYGLYTADDAKVEGTMEVPIVQSSSGTALTVNTDGGSPALELGVPTSDGSNIAGGNVVAGHPNNRVLNSAVGVVIGGGGNDFSHNIVGGDYAIVGGGWDNTASAGAAIVAGGEGNTASGGAATVGGGSRNTASGTTATVAGGSNNTASGQYSFAAGRQAKTQTSDGTTTYDGTVVFGDSTTNTVYAGNADEVRFQHAKFFVGEGNLPTGNGTTLVYDGATGEVIQSSSSARYKTNIESLSPDPGAVLELEPREFEYEERSERGVGLIAEEVDDHLPDLVNTDAEGRPDSVNYDRLGVYLIPEVRRQRDWIADLETETDSLREENDDLRAENDRLRERNAELEARLDRIEAHVGLTDSQMGVADD